MVALEYTVAFALFFTFLIEEHNSKGTFTYIFADDQRPRDIIFLLH